MEFGHINPNTKVKGCSKNVVNNSAWIFVAVIVEVFIFSHRLNKDAGMRQYLVIENKTDIAVECAGYLVVAKKVKVVQAVVSIKSSAENQVESVRFTRCKCKRPLQHPIHFIEPEIFGEKNVAVRNIYRRSRAIGK